MAALTALALLLVAAGVGYVSTGSWPDADASASAPAASPRPRGGKVLPLETALKELDLIRPARAKLAADFTLPTHGGGKVRMTEQRGKVVMINFWATWCPPCLEEMPAMERLYRAQKEGGFTLIAVSVDADPRKVAPFVTAHKLTFPIGLDPRMEMANTYGVRALPSSFIVTRDGHLAALAVGPRTWDNDAAHSLIEGLARK